MDYSATGTSRAFGSVTRQGGTRIAFEDLASQRAKSVEMNRELTPEEKDSSLLISGLQVREASDGEIKIDINAPVAPEFYYIDLRVDDWSSFMMKSKIIFLKTFANPMLSSNNSSWILSATDQVTGFGDLARHIQPNVRYSMRVALSKDGQKWGRVAETAFRLIRPRLR